MAKKKSSIKTSRQSWVKDTENRSLSDGGRICLFWEISRQAAEITKEGKDKHMVKEIRAEIAGLCSSTASNARIHKHLVGQYLRLKNLSKVDVRKLVKDADHKDPINKQTASQAKQATGKSRMTISHALLLAAVTDGAKREKLLDDAVKNHWSYKVLKAKSVKLRVGSLAHPVKSTGNKPVRNRQTINSIARTADELVKLLSKLSDDSFAESIKHSDRRNPADTLKKLNGLTKKLDEIHKQIPAVIEAAEVAAEALKEFIKQQR